MSDLSEIAVDQKVDITIGKWTAPPVAAPVVQPPAFKVTKVVAITTKRRLVIPNTTSAIKSVKVVEDGVANNSYSNGTIQLKNARPLLVVTVTFADKTTRAYTRNFADSKNLDPNNINLR